MSNEGIREKNPNYEENAAPDLWKNNFFSLYVGVSKKHHRSFHGESSCSKKFMLFLLPRRTNREKAETQPKEKKQKKMEKERNGFGFIR